VSELWKKRREQTEPDPRIGTQVFAINLQIIPAPKALQEIVQLQKKLAAELPAGCFLCPSHSLHLSVLPVIWARGDYGADVRALWAATSRQIQNSLSEVLSRQKVFSLKADSIEGRAQAILLRLSEHQALFDIRRAAITLLERHGLAAAMPDLAHVTMFRFSQSFDLDLVHDVVSRIEQPPISWKVDRLLLMEEQTYPSLVSLQMAEYSLL